MKSFYLNFLFFTFLASLLSVSTFAQVINLTPEDPIGKTLIIKVSTTSVMKSADSMTRSEKNSSKRIMKQEQELSVAFLSRNKVGNVDIVVKFLRFKIGMNTDNANKINFDSAHPEKDKKKIFSFMSNIIGKSVRITRDKKRRIIKITGYDNILAALPPNPLFKTMFNVNYIKRVIEDNNFLIMGLCGKKVKPGDTWTTKIKNKVPVGIAENISLLYKFAGIKNIGKKKFAMLTFKGSINIRKIKSPKKNMPEITLQNGIISGESLYDIKNRIITRTINKSSFDIVVSLKNMENGSSKKDMKTHVTSTTISTVEKMTNL